MKLLINILMGIIVIWGGFVVLTVMSLISFELIMRVKEVLQ